MMAILLQIQVGLNQKVDFQGQGKNIQHFGPFFQYQIGPVDFHPYDTVEVVIAKIAATGNTNLEALAELYRKAKILKHAYDLNFQTTLEMPKPDVNIFPDEEKVTLWWNGKAENYESLILFLQIKIILIPHIILKVTESGSSGIQRELMDVL